MVAKEGYGFISLCDYVPWRKKGQDSVTVARWDEKWAYYQRGGDGTLTYKWTEFS